MASERIRIEGEQLYREPLPAPATHITLPLDPALYDDAAIAVAAEGRCGRRTARKVIAIYAAHVAGGGA